MRGVFALLGAEAGVIVGSLYYPPKDELAGMIVTMVIILLAAILMYWVSRGGRR